MCLSVFNFFYKPYVNATLSGDIGKVLLSSIACSHSSMLTSFIRENSSLLHSDIPLQYWEKHCCCCGTDDQTEAKIATVIKKYLQYDTYYSAEYRLRLDLTHKLAQEIFDRTRNKFQVSVTAEDNHSSAQFVRYAPAFIIKVNPIYEETIEADIEEAFQAIRSSRNSRLSQFLTPLSLPHQSFN